MRQTRPYMVMGLCRSLVYTCASTASNLCSHCPYPVLCTASYPMPTLSPTCANLLGFLYYPFYLPVSSLPSCPPPGILSSILGRVFCHAQHQPSPNTTPFCLPIPPPSACPGPFLVGPPIPTPKIQTKTYTPKSWVWCRICIWIESHTKGDY